MSKLILRSPLAGWSTPLEEVPDQAFAERMLGDGVAIDPTNGTLHAPCDGEVLTVAAARHAITLLASGGAEILLHVGLDTVKLGGKGFDPLVREGARVSVGQPLLNFDLDTLARLAPSLLTPVIVMDGAGFSVTRRRQGVSVAVGDVLLELEQKTGARKTDMRPGGDKVTKRVVVTFEHGIHARPAAQLANSIKGYAAEIAVHAHGRKANARSGVALMALGVQRGDEVTLEAVGADAVAAIAALEAALSTVHFAPVTETPAAAATPALHIRDAADPRIIRGVVASRGIAVGRATHLGRAEPIVSEAGAGVPRENAELTRARAAVKVRIESLAATARGATREVLEAHRAFIDDASLVDRAESAIEQGKSAGFAWRQAVNECVAELRAVDDARVHERIDDLNDLASQVLLALAGTTASISLPERAIVLAEELLPSQFISLPIDRVVGICTAGGGPTSHVAILAAAVGVPMVVASGSAILAIAEGSDLVLDANAGALLTKPTARELESAGNTAAQQRLRRTAALAAAKAECRTADDIRIEVFANVGSLGDARAAVEQGAEGCGLLRTEFLFLDRDTPPDEAYQVKEYQLIADAFSGSPLVVRTLDAGGDKPIPYLPMAKEENPALGLRGVRTSLRQPELLRTQLRAVLAVQPPEQCRVLLPMITSAHEIRTVRRLLDEIRRELGRESGMPLGIMIETPAAALMADRLAAEADFLSIGTNDLTQYTLAMDRGHPQLAPELDGLHPAVLRLIAATAEAGRARNRRVSVCGGLASDLAAVPILIGLGVQGLSGVPSIVPSLKALIRTLSIDACRVVARRALEQESAAAVRELTAELVR